MYGSIGALMVTMVWIQLNSFILLVGFELNASLAVKKTEYRNLKKAGKR
ncbi:MAG TPA: YhjD/YihY/BrkB family envelope integrity protein [Saprospiraceae bacterium]|nr:YhjD/YihY/BrkB family envelope integrity protein [Saprospiraceae bacterium]